MRRSLVVKKLRYDRSLSKLWGAHTQKNNFYLTVIAKKKKKNKKKKKTKRISLEVLPFFTNTNVFLKKNQEAMKRVTCYYCSMFKTKLVFRFVIINKTYVCFLILFLGNFHFEQFC